MSLNKLVGGDCGGNNTLVQLSSIVGRDASMGHSSQANPFLEEFMAQNMPMPQTFNMNALLNSVENIDVSKPQSSKQSWQNEHTNMNVVPMQWNRGPAYIPQPQMMFPMMNNSLLFQPAHQPPSNVQIQYLNDTELKELQNTDVKAKAQELINSVDDDDLAYTQFMSFMNRVSSGELNLTSNTDERKMSQEEVLNQIEDKYKEEWNKLSDISDHWQSQSEFGIPKEYEFSEGNMMLENKSALELGKEKLKMGDIPGAVLCFEAAAKQQPDSAEVWFLLGTTQAENEQDPLAIAALRKSLEIDPTQLEAYITLAAAYTNENLSKQAIISLYDWMKASPKYSDMLPQDINPASLSIQELENHVKTIYMRAAQLSPSNIDPDVQNALGVLFNITQEYDKAADCFKTALMVADQDSKLWNRLGATLANSDRSEEAVDAYHQALSLEPGFIRARYNVGITCMNLGAHRQAAEHFLVALNQQNKARNLNPEANSADNSSSTIWSTFRMVCSFMGEHEVARLVEERNLTELNRFFHFE